MGAQNCSISFSNQQPYAGHSVGMPSLNTNYFHVKWLAGTEVTRCYGCGGDIQNPPLDVPDDLVIVYRDIRQYRDWYTGQLHRTDTAQNVHFHLRISCVHLTGSCLSVPMESAVRFRVEHVNSLVSEFGWTYYSPLHQFQRSV